MRRSRLAGLALGLGAVVTSGIVFLAGSLNDRPTSAVPPAHPANLDTPAPPLPGRIAISSTQLREAYAAGLTDRPVKSLLDVPKRMTYGDFVWNDTGVPPGPVW